MRQRKTGFSASSREFAALPPGSRCRRGGVGGIAPALALGILALVLAGAAFAADAPAVESGYAAVNGTTLYYEIAGKGHPLVLIHGGFMDRRMWDAQFEPLARHFRVIRYDQRGFGRSLANVTSPFSPVQDLAALLDHLGVRQAHVIGISLGANVALDFAVEHPERVSALVHVNGGISGLPFQLPPDAMQAMMGAMMAVQQRGDTSAAADQFLGSESLIGPLRKSNPAMLDLVRHMVLDNAHAFLWQPGSFQPQPPDPPAAQRLSSLEMPILAVIGEKNDVAGHEAAEKLASTAPRARRLEIPAAGHLINLEMPQKFNQLILEFLAGVDSDVKNES